MFGLPLELVAVLIIGGGMVASVAGLLLTRTVVKMQVGEGHNDIAGFIFATVGVVYAVALAFIVFAVWEKFADADRAVTAEAAALVTVFRDTQAFPEPYRDEAQAALRHYAEVTPETEWKSHGTLTVHKTPDPLNPVWNVYREVRAKDVKLATNLDDAEARLTALESLRHMRHLAGEATLPAIFWVILVAGGVVTVGFTYFFHMENLRVQAFMVASLAGAVASLLFLILALDHPFTGAIHVSAYPFEHALQQFNALNLGVDTSLP